MPNYGFMRQEIFTAEQLLISSVIDIVFLNPSFMVYVCPLKLYYYSSYYLGCRGGVCWRGGEAEEQPEGGHQGAGPSSQQLWQVQRGPGPRGCLQVRSLKERDHVANNCIKYREDLAHEAAFRWDHIAMVLTLGEIPC